MIEQTIFENNDEIINYVKNNYNLEVTEVTKIDRGSANIYSLNNNEYILKEFQSKYSKEQIEKEIAVINHLSGFGIKVPEYIKTKKDTFDDVYKEKTIIIQKYIDGYTLESNEGNYEQTIECADYYGRIVDALKTLPIELPDSDLSGWYSQENFDVSIKKHEDLLPMLDENNEIDKKIKNDILEKIEMITYISEGEIEGINIYLKRIPNQENYVLDVYGKRDKINNFINSLAHQKQLAILNFVTDLKLEKEEYSQYNLHFSNVDIVIKDEIDNYKKLKEYGKNGNRS